MILYCLFYIRRFTIDSSIALGWFAISMYIIPIGIRYNRMSDSIMSFPPDSIWFRLHWAHLRQSGAASGQPARSGTASSGAVARPADCCADAGDCQAVDFGGFDRRAEWAQDARGWPRNGERRRNGLEWRGGRKDGRKLASQSVDAKKPRV